MTEEFQNAAECWKTIIEDVDGNRGLLPLIEKYARENTDPAKIVFGTSGWRGEIGTDFTFNNIRIVTSAIIQMFRESDHKVMKAMGVADF
ncbi:MAG TPA: phosphomannomutase, partial [Nitrospirae bacterium]|nr:phosphomannomutase [Nitrospirota bacterium]HEW81460.1 phosphomannomutase [Nitrospirota bacterium]